MKELRYRTSSELRDMFLKFFEGHGCKRHQSFSLIPDDPTLLFTVAGMVPFKPYFLGLKTPDHKRATTAQKCIRTNDIENVGRTARHHTFFEMLGNFSFGDYFKKEMIPWAWEFLTEHVGLDPDRLYATIYLDDDESHDMWRDLVGLPEEKIFRLGDDDNFWAAGPVGPCGPCSEIIYDQGPEFSCGKSTCGVGCDCDRYLEIWNLVFMQYSRDETGKLTPLPHKNIDTGMGLERLCSVVQQVRGDFETDLFRPIIDKASSIAGITYGSLPKNDLAVRVISDHLRASAFMIADGVLPSNEGPGYVLRRIIRRSVRFGRLIGIEDPFLLDLLPTVNKIMADAYPELIEQRSTIEQIIANEEERFSRTLTQGTDMLEAELKKVRESGGHELSGETAFVLYDTFGFPLELTEEIADEHGMTVSFDDFDEMMKQQKERARASSKQTSAVIAKNVYTELADKLGATQFDGYTEISGDATVEAIVCRDEAVDIASSGHEVKIVLDRTPFYAERGGQVGDKGTLTADGVLFEVSDTLHPSGNLTVHVGHVAKGSIKVGQRLHASIDTKRRNAIRRHHTATHLLHESLTRVLGKHVRQAGSLVTPDLLRFDYNHFAPMTDEQIAETERIIYSEVLKATPVTTKVMSIEDAKKTGAKALFEEKYGDVVRVIEVPGFSTELCGGTHVSNVGEIGLVKIVREEGIGSGVRRITAVAGERALELMQNYSGTLAELSSALGADADKLIGKVTSLIDERKALEKKNSDLILKQAMETSGGRSNDPIDINGVKYLSEKHEDITKDMLRTIGDRYKQTYGDTCVLLLASVSDGQVVLIGMASDGAVKRGVNAGMLVKSVSSMIAGSGGGKPTMGQGGGKDPSKLDDALAQAEQLVRAQLAK